MWKRMPVRGLTTLLPLLFLTNSATAQSPFPPTGGGAQQGFAMPEIPRLNIDARTMGGRQFWGDVLFFRGWRIQHNVLTNHYRLLDPADVRRAWGSEAECRHALEKFKREYRLPPMSGRAVVLVHGIIRSSKSFGPLRRRLEEEGDTVVGFDYPSTQVTISDAAGYLHRVLQSLEGIEEIDIVAHSMGGLLVRYYLQQSEEKADPRLRRMVMLGVPNLGARMANVMQQNILYRWIFGPAGKELVEDPEGLIAHLPTPKFEFAVIAGARGTPAGWNPLIPGDDDGTVTVASTRLPGAADFLTVGCLHSFLMNDREVGEAVARFLNTGCLHANGVCQPIIKTVRAHSP